MGKKWRGQRGRWIDGRKGLAPFVCRLSWWIWWRGPLISLHHGQWSRTRVISLTLLCDFSGHVESNQAKLYTWCVGIGRPPWKCTQIWILDDRVIIFIYDESYPGKYVSHQYFISCKFIHHEQNIDIQRGCSFFYSIKSYRTLNSRSSDYK